MTINSYAAYWRRGWWALLLVLVANIGLGLCYAGLAMMLRAITDNPYPIAVALVWFTFGAPLLGWLFEVFAARSRRLSTSGIEALTSVQVGADPDD